MQAELAAQQPVTKGSRGQVISHPLLSEIRLTSLALAKLTKTLALPQPKTSGARRGRLPSVVRGA
jgi:hypothetical protein